MMSGHNKDWTSRTLANPPPPMSNNISFLAYSPPPLPPLKVGVICVSPLMMTLVENNETIEDERTTAKLFNELKNVI